MLNIIAQQQRYMRLLWMHERHAMHCAIMRRISFCTLTLSGLTRTLLFSYLNR